MASGMNHYMEVTEHKRLESLHSHEQNVYPEMNKHTDQGNQISNAAYRVQEPVSHEMPSSIPDSRKKGASRMAGFMFWTNGIGVFLLLVGFVTPGWLILHDEEYQDYGLWYMTQCSVQGVSGTCQTLSYHTIEAIFNNQFHRIGCGEYDHKCGLRFGGLKFNQKQARSLLYFANAPLPFTYSDIAQFQALYTVGLILAILTLKVWYRFQKRVRKNRTFDFSKRKLAFMFILSILSVFFVLFAVIGFAVLESDIVAYSKSPIGRVFAGFGGGMMLLCTIVIFMHLTCFRNSYICGLGCRKRSQQKQDV